MSKRVERSGTWVAAAAAALVAICVAVWGAPVAVAGDAVASAASTARSSAAAEPAPRRRRLERYRRWIVLRFGAPPSVGPLEPDNDRLNALWRSLALRYGADGRPQVPDPGAEVRV